MAYDIELALEPDENLELDVAFQISEKAPVFNFAVSDRAIYWPEKKTFAVRDATYFKRIRNDEVSEVCVKRLPPYGLWIFAALMILAGMATIYFMFVPFINHEAGEHQVSGWPFAIFIGGILLPIAARGRLSLEIKTFNKTYRWKPPLVIDKASKQKIQMTFDEIITACKKSGLRVLS